MRLPPFLDHPPLPVLRGQRALWQEALLSLVMVFAAACVSYVLMQSGFPSPEALSILFVLPVLAAAIFLDLRLALVTVALSVITYNLVLLPPFWTFDLTNPQAVAKIVVLLIVTLVVSALTTRLRRITGESQARENVLGGLYQLNQDLVGKTTVAQVQAASEACLSALTTVPCQIWYKDVPVDDPLLSEAAQEGASAGAGQVLAPHDPRLILPLIDGEKTLGVLVFTPQDHAPFPVELFPPSLLPTLAAQVASALSRAALAEAHEQQVRQADRERFMSAMLSSLSHDFKTPLVGIVGALEALEGRVDSEARDIVADGLAEALRLNRYVVNLVEISRLEAGVRPRSEPLHIRDAVSGVLRTLRPLIGRQKFRITVEAGFPLLNLNASLFDLVLLNLIENALKYGPPEGEITIDARVTSDGVEIDVDDEGAGIPPPLREPVFTKFYRAVDGDRKIAGTGLGLYICREIVASYGGRIEAIDPPDGTGACMRVWLPEAATLRLATLEEETE
jgi:two-component system sensor histidine kinase KdpD